MCWACRLTILLTAEIKKSTLTLRALGECGLLLMFVDIVPGRAAHAIRAAEDGGAIVDDPMAELISAKIASGSVPSTHGSALSTAGPPVVDSRAGLEGSRLRS